MQEARRERHAKPFDRALTILARRHPDRFAALHAAELGKLPPEPGKVPPARDAEAARYRALAALSAEHPDEYGRLLAEHGGRPGEAHEALARLYPARLQALLVVELAAAPPRGPAPRRRTLLPCGTPGAYQRHRVNGEETDVACRLAMAAVAVTRRASDDTARARYNADERYRTSARAALAANHWQEYRTLLDGRDGRDGTNATNVARAELALRHPEEFRALLAAARRCRG